MAQSEDVNSADLQVLNIIAVCTENSVVTFFTSSFFFSFLPGSLQ